MSSAAVPWRWPAEFADLLTRQWQRVLDKHPHHPRESGALVGGRFGICRNVIDERVAVRCREWLDTRLYRHLETLNKRIPPESISEAREEYAETLEKTIRVKSAFFQRRTARVHSVAEEYGLLQTFCSKSFVAFVETITGLSVGCDDGFQILCYEEGDYVGPHTDHYPRSTVRRNGYLDIHVMFCNDQVRHQWLVYEDSGYLCRIENLALDGALAAYRLPFWHYTTPLAGKRRSEKRARRWVLLRTFGLEGEGSMVSVRPSQP